MKVVLLSDIKKLGKASEIVEVSDGYARNMLIKKGLALPATNSNLNDLKLKLKNEEKKEEHLQRIALENKKTIEETTINLFAKAGPNGKTFGAITNKEIADAIKKQLNIDIDKKQIDLDGSIKNVGAYDINIKLHKDITASLKLVIDTDE